MIVGALVTWAIYIQGQLLLWSSLITTGVVPGYKQPRWIRQQDFHRRYLCIVRSLGYLVTMTSPDFAWSYSELSKHVQFPVITHIEAAEHVLRYLCDTWNESIIWKTRGKNGENASATDRQTGWGLHQCGWLDDACATPQWQLRHELAWIWTDFLCEQRRAKDCQQEGGR